jgi:hypothetical protein
MVSGRIVCAGFKWRTDLRTGKLQARIAIKEEIAKTGQGSKEAEDSDDILFVYLIDLDGA